MLKTGIAVSPRTGKQLRLLNQQDACRHHVANERIDPQYRTAGSYYFNNDLESSSVCNRRND
jgi:hypothetical protein